MGKGRKKQTDPASEGPGPRPPQPPVKHPRNITTSFRNLRKSDLKGVIFACSHNTKSECLGKQLFGLPPAHFSYVRNIEPGLPLFLFNYSDRKLHGIYEAAGQGQTCIDSHAWTGNGTEKTAYPTQVRIRIRTECLPLTEKQYSEIIKDNYCTKQRFWFELDHEQTSRLIALFRPSPIPLRTISLPNQPIRRDPTWDEVREPNSDRESEWASEEVQGTPSGSEVDWSSNERELKEPSGCQADWLEKNVWGSLSGSSDHPPFLGQQSGAEVSEMVSRNLQNQVIYLIGGCNDSSWLSSLDSFSPSVDIVKPLKSMSSACAHASATALNGNLYVFGGGDGTCALDTVECYNPMDDKWISSPNLSCPKVCLAGATLGGKIYAIGGGSDYECFSDVEMFDPALGKWINIQPMLQKLFSHVAAELNGALYAVGGYDGICYLQSVERYDPREANWTHLPDMKTSRGSPSSAVFNEKLRIQWRGSGSKR